MLDLTQIPTLDTPRLHLRRPAEADADGLAELYADPRYMRFFGDGRTADHAAAWGAIAGSLGHWALRGFGFFAVEEKATGRFIGWSGLLSPKDWPGVEIAWGIAPRAWWSRLRDGSRKGGARRRLHPAPPDAAREHHPPGKRRLDPRRDQARRALRTPDRTPRPHDAPVRHHRPVSIVAENHRPTALQPRP